MAKGTKQYLKKPYARVLIPEDDGSFFAEILEFPGCFAAGSTANVAIRNLEKATENWLEAALSEGQEIPEPFASQEYSGKIALRIPKSLHKQAARLAEKDAVSLNQFFVTAIAARGGAEEVANRVVERLQHAARNYIVHAQATVNAETAVLILTGGAGERRLSTATAVTKVS